MATTQHSLDANAQIGAGLLFGAGAAVLGLLAPTRPLVGAAVYAVAALLAAAVRFATDDGSDTPNRARSPADTTLAVGGLAAAVVFPGLVAATGLGYFTWTPLTAGIGLTIAAVFVLYGAVTVGRQVRGAAA
ncbi:hypothetical protein ACOZ4N_13360 [Halorientalis pallida]|uniref:hypothetical protein n=1 Tax=Halorientalis pallida TaxID=2479928 RepID=UPI003C6F25F4